MFIILLAVLFQSQCHDVLKLRWLVCYYFCLCWSSGRTGKMDRSKEIEKVTNNDCHHPPDSAMLEMSHSLPIFIINFRKSDVSNPECLWDLCKTSLMSSGCSLMKYMICCFLLKPYFLHLCCVKKQDTTKKNKQTKRQTRLLAMRKESVVYFKCFLLH